MPESVKDALERLETPSDTRVMNALLSDQFAGKLEALAQAKAEEYKANTPYPHIYFDNFLPVEVAEAALRDFPEPKEADWHAYTDVNQRKKLAFDVVEKLPPSIRDVLYFLNSRPMLKFLETLTGISERAARSLLHRRRPASDQAWRPPGSARRLQLSQRAAAGPAHQRSDLSEQGLERGVRGALRAMGSERDASGEEDSSRLQPLRHLQHHKLSFHGHPIPLACPPDRNRKSIATYYYSNGRPEEDPELTHRHEVAFQERPGINSVKATIRIKKAIRAITPPILTDLIGRCEIARATGQPRCACLCRWKSKVFEGYGLSAVRPTLI